MRRRMLSLAVLLTTLAATGVVYAQTSGSLDASEQAAMSDTLQYALENNPTKEVSNWVNPDTGHSGAVVPVKTYTNELGQPCREFVTTIVIGGQEEQGYGTACRQPDGTWQIVADEQIGAEPPAQTNVYVYAPPERYYYVYPESYYYYPSSFYYPYHIYLSFNYVFRSGYLHFGTYFLDGPRFRHRYPVHVHSRVYLGPRLFTRYPWYRNAHAYHRRHVRQPAYQRQYPMHQKRYDYRRPGTDGSRDRNRYDYRQQRELKNRGDSRQRQNRPAAIRQQAPKMERRSPSVTQRQSINRVTPQVKRDNRYHTGNRQDNPARYDRRRQNASAVRDVDRRTQRVPAVRQGRANRSQNAPSVRHRTANEGMSRARSADTRSHVRSPARQNSGGASGAQRDSGRFDGARRGR